MKSIFHDTRLAVVMSILVLWGCSLVPASAGKDPYNGIIPLNEIYEKLGVPVDSGHGRGRHECPRPNDFELLRWMTSHSPPMMSILTPHRIGSSSWAKFTTLPVPISASSRRRGAKSSCTMAGQIPSCLRCIPWTTMIGWWLPRAV